MSPSRIPIREVAAWLNQDRLPPDSWMYQEFSNLSRLPVHNSDRLQRTSRLIWRVDKWSESERKAFWLAQCAVLRFEEDCFGDASDLLQRSNALYASMGDERDRAVTGYMYSITLGRLGNHWQAADCAGEAILSLASYFNFNSCPDDKQKKFLVNAASEQLESPISVYKSLFTFEKSRLGPSAEQLQEDLRNKIEKVQGEELQDQARIIEHEMACLIRVAQSEGADTRNCGEALAYCGLMNYMMGEKHKAIEKFKDALPMFDQSGHTYPLLSWMMHNIQADIYIDPKYKTPVKVCGLMSGLEKSIRGIETLRTAAQKQNLDRNMNWYALQHDSMKLVLKNITEKLWGKGNVRSDCQAVE